MPDSDHPSLISDRPARPDEDFLDFRPYRRTLSGIIAAADTATPLTIGVFGSWGAGKTTLLRMVQEDLSKDHITVWFTAWKYDKQEVLWRALLLAVVAEVRQSLEQQALAAGKKALDEKTAQVLDDLEETLYHAIERVEQGGLNIDWVGAGTGVAQTVVQGVLASIPGINLLQKVMEALGEGAATAGPKRVLDAFKRAQKQVHVAQVASLEQFEKKFGEIIANHVHPKRLVVFVDDLDRCLPHKAVDVLEAIKLFLDVEGCVFVLGMARDVITQGIKIKYGELGAMIDGERYLEKIIQVPFDLPMLEVEDLRSYVTALAPSLPDARCGEVFAAGLGEPNPRRIKRMLNSYLFVSRLALERVNRVGKLNDVRLAKIVAIQHGQPALYALLRGTPRYLAELEDYYRKLADATSQPQKRRPAAPTLPEALKPHATEALGRLLLLCDADADTCFAGLKDGDIRPYFALVRSVATPADEAAPRANFEPETVSIPAGVFPMGTSPKDISDLLKRTEWAEAFQKNGPFDREQPQHSVSLDAYAIGRYPVTNLEYEAFVQASGHAPPRYWNGQAAPEKLTDHPVVEVSWDDAVAYCAWLSQRTGRPYRLPTEAEWEKAARGTDGRHYPWGNDFDPSRCNTAESKIGTTSPVGDHHTGDSPHGCADMAGNIWEWCQDWYAEGYYQGAPGTAPLGPAKGDDHVVRGGSWIDGQRFARCAYRNYFSPSYRNFSIGFRVIVGSPISPGG